VRVADVLRQAKTAADDACRDGAAGLDPEWLARMSRAYTAAATVGYNVTSGRTNEVEAKHHALARRLLARRHDILRFAYDLRVPFDNNGSEVRHEVARIKWARRREDRQMMMSVA